MRKLVESIHIMNKFTKEIGYRTSLLVDFNFPKQTLENISDKNLTLLISLFSMSVIDSISFLDEYQQVYGQKTENIFKDRIIITKAINKPFISKINEWKNLRDLRNHLLAHNLRVGKNGDFIFSIKGLIYNAPRNLNDLFLLHNLISFSAQTINLEFTEELKTLGLIPIENVAEGETILSKDDVSNITIDLITIANRIKKEQNRNYEFAINNTIDWNEI